MKFKIFFFLIGVLAFNFIYVSNFLIKEIGGFLLGVWLVLLINKLDD